MFHHMFFWYGVWKIMKKDWGTTSNTEIWGKRYEEPYRFDPHNLKKPKHMNIGYCKHCGLVPLSNRISKLCWKLGCDYRSHQQYKRWIKNGKKF